METKKILSKVLVTSMIAGTLASMQGVSAESTSLPTDLNDIKSEGAKEAVKYLFEQNKLSGYTDNTFRPDKEITRAEFAAMLLRTVDAPNATKTYSFADSKEGQWHYNVMNKAYENGLLSGTGVKDGKVVMEPNALITREEMLTILVRAYEQNFGKSSISQTEIDSLLSKFNDKDEIPKWAVTAMAKALKYEITSGVSSNTLGVGKKGDRLESAIFSYRVLKDVEEKKEDTSSEENTTEETVVEAGDTTAPIITLVGGEVVEVNLGKTYSEPGYAALDEKDGDITSKVVVGGIVDTGKTGSYTLTYSVTDAAGNSSGYVTRTVNVVDNVSPEISLLSGNSITLNLGENFVEPGYSATDNYDGDITNKVVVSGNVDINKVGSYTLTYTVSDMSGNEASSVTRTINVVDAAAPSISLVDGDVISVNQGETFVEPGFAAIDNNDGDISANVVVTGSVDTNVTGSYVLSYDVTDASGNAATTVTRTVNVVDVTAPVIGLIGDSSVTINEGESFVDTGFVASDNNDGDITANVVVGGDVVDVYAPGSYTITYNVVDAAGNSANEVTRTVTVVEALADEVIYVKDSNTTINETMSIQTKRFNATSSQIHFVSVQALDDGQATPTDYEVKDVNELVMVLKHGEKVDGEYPNVTVYSLVVDDNATNISIDNNDKTVAATSNDTLKDIKTAFETQAYSVFGDNEVDFYSEFDGDIVVAGSMKVLIENDDKSLMNKFDVIEFGDALGVTVNKNSIDVSGLNFEDMLDFYKWDSSTSQWVKDASNSDVEVGVSGTHTFAGLTVGKYKVVQQPIELGSPGEQAYDDEYNKRLTNETTHEITPKVDVVINGTNEMRLEDNYDGGFAFTTTDNTMDFVKVESEIADITNSGKLFAEVVYEDRLERINFKSITMNFGTETLDLDGDGTPETTYQTLSLNPVADYEEFALGESVNFTLVLTDKADATSEETIRVEVEMTATVVLDNKTGVLNVELSYR